MVEAFRTSGGTIIRGAFGEALAKADPSRGISIRPTGAEILTGATPSFVSGGGGGTDTGTTSTVKKKTEPTPSPTILKVRERAKTAESLRDLAAQRGIDISTPVRELGFLNTVRGEIKRGELTSTEQQLFLGSDLIQETPQKITLEKRVIDTSVQGIPITEIFVIDALTGGERVATFKEARDFRKQEQNLVIGTKEKPTRLTLKDLDVKESFLGEKFFRKNSKGDFIKVQDALPFFLEPPKTPAGSQGLFVKRNGKFVPFSDKSVQSFIEQKLSKVLVELGDKSASAIAPLLPDAVNKVLQKQTPKGEFRFTDALKFLFFAPLLQTGAVKKTSVKAKVKAKVKPKVTIKSVSAEFEKDFVKGNKAQINDRIKGLARAIKFQTDVNKKSIAVNNFKNLLTELQKKGIIKGFVLDQQTGRFAVNSFTGTSPTASQTIVTLDISDVLKQIAKSPELKGLGGILTGVQSITAPIQKPTVSKLKVSETTKPAIKTLDKILASFKIKIDTRTKQLQTQITQLKQQEKQITNQFQKSVSKSKQKQLQNQINLLKTQQVQKTKQIQRQKQVQQQTFIRTKIGGKSVGKGFGFPILPPFSGGKRKKKKVVKKKIRIERFGFNVFGKSRGKFLKLNKRPISRKHARSLGAFLIDRSTSRTFKLRPTNKKARKPLRKFPTNYFTKTRRKYRNFRILKGKKIQTPLKWIEKRSNLIDTIGEKKGLKLARQLRNLKTRRIKTKSKKPFKPDKSSMSKKLKRRKNK